jgi:hypothetical protein
MSTSASSEWPWPAGVVYTVRPEMLAPLERDREYRILVGVRRIALPGEPFIAYGELYRRAVALTESRLAALDCPEPPARWTEWHGWRAVEFGDRELIFVFIATVVKVGGEVEAGERPPAEDELALPGGATREMLMQRSRRHVDEFYNGFDHRTPGGDGTVEDSVFSYGEYVASSEGIDFEPFVQRAERMMRLHYGPGVRILRHDCFCATHPDVAVVHVVFRP